MTANEYRLILTDKCISITREPVAEHVSELILRSSVANVTPVFDDAPPTGYRFDTMTIVVFTMSDGEKLNIELQEITNNPSWSDGTFEALEKFINDYKSGDVTELTEYYHTSTSVMLEWDNNGYSQYDLYYGPTPLTAPNLGTVPTTTSATNSKLITGLVANTQYSFYVRSSSNGAWAGPYTMTTAQVAFIFTIDTTKTSTGSTNSTSFRPTLRAGKTYNCVIDWGDASTTNQVNATSPTHVYAAPGVYTVKITGTFYGFNFNNTQDRLKMISITNWGDVAWGDDQTFAFRGCTNLTVPATDKPSMVGVTSLFGYFLNCTALTVGKLNGWDVSAIQIFTSMFSGCANFNTSISRWQITSATSLDNMLAACVKFNHPLNDWRFPLSITSINFLGGCSLFNQPVNDWNVGHMTHLVGSFSNCAAFNQELSNWDLSSCVSLNSFLIGCSAFNKSLNTWDVSGVLDFNSMFRNCTAYNQSMSNWVTSSATDMQNMFSSAISFNQSVNHFVMNNVTNIQAMFKTASAFNQPLNSWNTANVTNMREVFYGTLAFNQSLNSWNVAKVTTFVDMFKTAAVYNQPMNNWVTTAATTMAGMFEQASEFNQSSLDNFDMVGVLDISRMFSLTPFNGTLNGWNTSTITNMTAVFFNNPNFNQPLNNWNTGSVTNMSYLFASTPFNQDIGVWNTSSVISFYAMFYANTSFNYSVNNWDVSNCEDFTSMFDGCTSYNQPMNNWIFSTTAFNGVFMDYMFQNATSFNQDIGGWNVEQFASGIDFMNGKSPANFSAANLDAIYNGWSLTANGDWGPTFDFGTIKYTAGGQAGKDILTGFFWSITDGGI